MNNEYTMKSILAVIISYNCTDLIRKNVVSLYHQTGKVLIIDNGSSLESLNIIRNLQSDGLCEAILYESNEGIPVRLNQAVNYASERNYELLLTMDQDTVLDDDAVSKLVEIINKDKSVVSVGPRRTDKRLNKKYYYKDYLITSGNLVRISAIKKVGGYRNMLFIDMVDIDISLALRLQGYKLAIANEAKMQHKVGEPEKNKMLFFNYTYLSHSAKRFYYIYKNLAIINRLYFKAFPLFCLKMDFFHIVSFLRIILEKSAKEKYISAIKGFKEGKKVRIEFSD